MHQPSGSADTSAPDVAAPPAALFRPKGREAGHDAEAIRRPSVSYWQDAWLRLRKNRMAMASAAFILLLGASAVIVPEVIPYEYDEQEIWNKHAPPNLGEDVLVVQDAPEEGQADLTADITEAEGDQPAADEFGTEPPTAPRNFRLQGPALTTGVSLVWDPVPGVEGYRIYRSIDRDSLGLPLEDLTPDRVRFEDTSSLAKGTTYHYFIAAFNAFGDSPEPGHVEVRPEFALTLSVAQSIDPKAEIGGRVRLAAHPFGTDHLGRDMLARVMMGARVSLTIGLVAPLIYILIGIIYGSISGFVGGFVDNVMMRITDIVATIPDLLVVIILQVVLGSGLATLIIAMVSVAWARSAIQIRGEVLRLREMEFVHAATVLGTRRRVTVFRHLLPNVMGTVLIVGTLAVPNAIFSEAFLSFIGLGIRPPMASWGVLTKEGRAGFLSYPHELLIPSVLICLTMLAFNLLGDGLRDALDPKMRGTK